MTIKNKSNNIKNKILNLKNTVSMIKESAIVENNGYFLTYFVLSIVAGCTVVLCFLNKPIEHDNKLQSIVVSIFCISAALLYALFMIVSRLLSLILTYAENINAKHTSNYEYVGDDEDCMMMAEEDEENQSICNNDNNNVNNGNNHYVNSEKNNHNATRQCANLPRNVVISSMYFGGSGAFLAISPLCMWDITVTTSFILSLIILSWFDCGKVAIDFKPNIDTASVISNLKKLRFVIHFFIVCTLFVVVSIDYLSFSSTIGQIFVSSYENGNNNAMIGDKQITSKNSLSSIIANYTKATYGLIPENTIYHEKESESSIFMNYNNNKNNVQNGDFVIVKWPFILLAMTSPIMLRAGGGGGGQFRHCMSPSQTLETGLPVSALLSILVLCWYSPSSIELIGHIQFGSISTIIPMLILCPPCISSTLIFLLRGFKTRMSYVPSVIITCILVIRQQITRKLEDYLDWVSVFNAIVAIITLIVFFIYQKKVIIGQNTAKHVAVIIGQNTAKHVAISKKNIDGVELPKHTSSSSTSRENEMVKHSVLVADAPTKLSKSKLDCSVDGDRVDDYDEFFYSECGEIVDLIDNNKIIAV